MKRLMAAAICAALLVSCMTAITANADVTDVDTASETEVISDSEAVSDNDSETETTAANDSEIDSDVETDSKTSEESGESVRFPVDDIEKYNKDVKEYAENTKRCSDVDITKTISMSDFAQASGWNNRQGVLGHFVSDLTGDGRLEIVRYKFEDNKLRCEVVRMNESDSNGTPRETIITSIEFESSGIDADCLIGGITTINGKKCIYFENVDSAKYFVTGMNWKYKLLTFDEKYTETFSVEQKAPGSTGFECVRYSQGSEIPEVLRVDQTADDKGEAFGTSIKTFWKMGDQGTMAEAIAKQLVEEGMSGTTKTVGDSMTALQFNNFTTTADYDPFAFPSYYNESSVKPIMYWINAPKDNTPSADQTYDFVSATKFLAAEDDPFDTFDIPESDSEDSDEPSDIDASDSEKEDSDSDSQSDSESDSDKAPIEQPDYDKYVKEVLVPKYGMADTKRVDKIIAESDIGKVDNWVLRDGILDYVVGDMNGDGVNDLVVYRFDGKASRNTLLADFYWTGGKGKDIKSCNSVVVSCADPYDFDYMAAGMMDVKGEKYIYVEHNNHAIYTEKGENIAYEFFKLTPDGRAYSKYRILRSMQSSSGYDYVLETTTYNNDGTGTVSREVIWDHTAPNRGTEAKAIKDTLSSIGLESTKKTIANSIHDDLEVYDHGDQDITRQAPSYFDKKYLVKPVCMMTALWGNVYNMVPPLDFVNFVYAGFDRPNLTEQTESDTDTSSGNSGSSGSGNSSSSSSSSSNTSTSTTAAATTDTVSTGVMTTGLGGLVGVFFASGAASLALKKRKKDEEE